MAHHTVKEEETKRKKDTNITLQGGDTGGTNQILSRYNVHVHVYMCNLVILPYMYMYMYLKLYV